jgi:hypothetical protein
VQARKAAGVGARSKVEILAAEQDMYVSRTTGERLAGAVMREVKASASASSRHGNPESSPLVSFFSHNASTSGSCKMFTVPNSWSSMQPSTLLCGGVEKIGWVTCMRFLCLQVPWVLWC